jgi:hypothetical protein
MRDRRWSPNSGNALLEFTLVALPLIFILISTFEIARGMWLYNTLGYALRQAARFVIVHGNDCAIAPNACRIQIGDIANVIQYHGVGLPPAEVQLQFISSAGTTIPGNGWVTLQDCLPPSGSQSSTWWPTAAPGATTEDPRGSRGVDAEIRGRVRFTSTILLFWPGLSTVVPFGEFRLPANSRQAVVY